MKALALSAGLLLQYGCYSFSTLGRARIVEAHRLEVFGAPAMLLTTAGSGAMIKPVGDLGVRYGLNDRVELDGRLTSFGVTLGPRVQLRRSPSPSDGLDVLVAPALAYTYPDFLAVEVPLLLGWNVRAKDQIILAPRVVYQVRLVVPGLSRPASFILAGASLGYAWRLSPRVTLLPELALLTQAYAEPGFSSNVAGGLGAQASVGVLLYW